MAIWDLQQAGQKLTHAMLAGLAGGREVEIEGRLQTLQRQGYVSLQEWTAGAKSEVTRPIVLTSKALALLGEEPPAP
jgi:hypothetical protein